MTLLQPLGDRVVVRPDEPEEVTRGGIVIPDVAQERPRTGEVLAAGPGRVLDSGRLHPNPLQAGDRILFSRYGGTEVEYGGEALLVLPESEVLAVIGAEPF